MIVLTVVYYWIFKKFLEFTGLLEPVSNFTLEAGNYLKNTLKL